MSKGVELRLRGEQVVLGVDADGVEAALCETPLDADLIEALDEWARVAVALLRQGDDAGVSVVSRRGKQLAGRVAAVLQTPVRYQDPITGQALVVSPPRRPVSPPVHTATPWGTGLTVSAFIAVFMIVALLALADTLATEIGTVGAVVALVLVTAGLAPSLWLGRRVPIVRWIVFGAATGVGLAWIGVLLTL